MMPLLRGALPWRQGCIAPLDCATADAAQAISVRQYKRGKGNKRQLPFASKEQPPDFSPKERASFCSLANFGLLFHAVHGRQRPPCTFQAQSFSGSLKDQTCPRQRFFVRATGNVGPIQSFRWVMPAAFLAIWLDLWTCTF